jgi:pimeloyl-ACP methyl ester carboxylesterase
MAWLGQQIASNLLIGIVAFGFGGAIRAEIPPPPAAAPASLKPPSSDSVLQSITFDSPPPSRRAIARGWVREKVVTERDLAKYRLTLDNEWQRAPADNCVVVLIHGFNSTPARSDGLMAPIRAAKYPCGTFAYPNDYTLSYSAELLSRELKQFAHDHPHRRVALVCHSTGGLVARACLENAELDPGNVDRLIMIAPPTHGSQLARFACGTDVWEHWLTRTRGWPWTRVRDSIVDGLGEAADELCPESAFLTDLNGRPRNSRVRYSILLGDDACMTDAEVAWIRENVCERILAMPGIDGHAERLDAALADVDELIDGKGDGVVAVKRGRLDGVDDIVVMRFSHMAVGAAANKADLSAVYQAVLERLE